MIGVRMARCPNCLRETIQIKGRCKWCQAKPVANKPLVNKVVQDPYIDWKATSYVFECPGCGAPFRYLDQLKRHKSHCNLL